jgi:hypothetical protein
MIEKIVAPLLSKAKGAALSTRPNRDSPSKAFAKFTLPAKWVN